MNKENLIKANASASGIEIELTSLSQLETSPDTTFLIKQNLKGESGKTYKIAKGVVLNFQGGAIKGSCTIEGTNTALLAPISCIFDLTVKATGSWLVDRAYPQWFDEQAGKDLWNTATPHDCSIAINRAITMKQTGEVFLSRGAYFISRPLILTHGIQLIGEYENRIQKTSELKDPDDWAVATWIIPFLAKDTQGKSLDHFVTTFNVVVSLPNGLNQVRQFTAEAPIIQVNYKQTCTINNTLPQFGEGWDVPYVNPSGCIKNIAIWNYSCSGDKETRNKDMIAISKKECCVVGGGYTFENIYFKNFAKAVRWTNDYCDNKCVLRCGFGMNSDIKRSQSSTTYYIDLGANGDATQIRGCFTDWNNRADGDICKALIIRSCHAGTVSDNILNCDVVIEGGTNMIFSANHLEAGAQLRLINSDIAIRNCYFEKGARPSVVLDVKAGTSIVDDGTECFSQVEMSGTTFVLYGPSDLYTNPDAISQYGRTPLKDVCPYDVALCSQLSLPYVMRMTENYRLVSHLYRSNQPVGIAICTFDTDPNTNWEPLTEFNNHSYFLSTESILLPKGNVAGNRYFDSMPRISATVMTNEQVPVPPEVSLPDGTKWPFSYKGQAILDEPRRIAGNVFDFEYGTYIHNSANNHGNLIGISWYDGKVGSAFILRIVRIPSMTPGKDFDVVEIPMAGARYIYDNYLSVNGYLWQSQSGTSTSDQFPANNTSIVTAVHFNDTNVKAFAPQYDGKTAGWVQNDTIYNVGSVAKQGFWIFNGLTWLGH